MGYIKLLGQILSMAQTLFAWYHRAKKLNQLEQFQENLNQLQENLKNASADETAQSLDNYFGGGGSEKNN